MFELVKSTPLHNFYSVCYKLPLHTVVTAGKKKKRRTNIDWSMAIPEKATPVTRTTSWFYPISTQLRDPINSGLARWRLTVYVDAVAESGRNPASKHQIQTECGECRTRLARPNYQAQTKTGKNQFSLFSWSALSAEYGSTRYGCQSCSWSAE